MKIKRIIYGTLGLLVFAPIMTSAAVFCSYSGVLNSLCNILKFVADLVRNLIPIFFALALVYFFWGVAMYVRNAGDAKKASDGKSIMIHGAIAIAVMSSIFGIAAALQGLFGIDQTSGITLPTTIPGL